MLQKLYDGFKHRQSLMKGKEHQSLATPRECEDQVKEKNNYFQNSA